MSHSIFVLINRPHNFKHFSKLNIFSVAQFALTSDASIFSNISKQKIVLSTLNASKCSAYELVKRIATPDINPFNV